MKTFKTQVYMNRETEQYCRRAFGVRRAIWNWTLAQFLETKKATNKLPSNYSLDKTYRELCKSQPDKFFVWLAGQMVSARAAQETMKDIVAAFALARTQGKKLHKHGLKPSFKKKKRQKTNVFLLQILWFNLSCRNRTSTHFRVRP